MSQQPVRPACDESHRRPRVALAVLLAALAASPALAVFSSDTATQNFADPGGSASAAWQLQGTFGAFVGTPIAPNLFIAAKHIGYAGAGIDITVGGTTYTTTASYDVGDSDLRIFRIDTVNGTKTFNSYATLYDAGLSGSETGKSLFVAGRGGPRGAVFSPAGSPVGYTWTGGGNATNWGTSTVSGIVNDDTLGNFVTFDFTQTGGLTLSDGDSSGGLFVFADGAWKLAGVNYGVDSGWSTTQAGPYTNASVYDARGLWVGRADDGNPNNDPDNEFVPNGPTPIVGQSYASRISSNRSQINEIFLLTDNDALVPEPTTLAAVAGVALIAVRRRAR